MKSFDAIPLRPLRMKGIFGVSSHIFRHGFLAALSYVLLFRLLSCLLYGLSLLPGLLSLLRGGALYGLWEGLLNTLYYGRFMINLSLLTRVLGWVFLSLLLLLLAYLIVNLLLRPIHQGVMYREMSMRIQGSRSSLGEMLRRGRCSLKQYFSTYLAVVLARLALRILRGIALGGFAAGVLAMLLPIFLGGFSRGFGAALILGLLVALAYGLVGLLGRVFLSAAFPCAVNEPEKKGFPAVGRSFSLSGSRFFPFLGAWLLLTLLAWLFTLPFSAANLIACGVNGGSLRPALALICGLCAAFIGLCREMYAYALSTVLYFDARIRGEGSNFLNHEENPPQAETINEENENTDKGDEYGTQDASGNGPEIPVEP